MKLNTVNVLEYSNGSFLSVESWEDNDAGNALAEAAFSEKALKNGFDAESIDFGLEEGLCEQGDYQIAIIHSI